MRDRLIELFYDNNVHCDQKIEGLVDDVMDIVSDLINRQKAELDDLKRDDLPRCKDALRRANEIGIDLEKENKELKAEIEKWELLNSILLESCNGYSKACDTYKAEIERLNEEVDKQYEISEANVRAEITSGGTSCHWCEDKVRAEAIKEFAERLKSVVAIHNGDMWSKYGYIDNLVKEYIDNLVKEMVGDNNG